ncbi:MAG: RluA family pseudouridine synthase [Deltaproteobacteria bacterium]|nr:RluA family pseudouridine synthase [Deltaproteobacteria bacterium]
MVDTPRIIFSDDSIIALDKPAEMPAVCLSVGDPFTVAAWLLKQFPEQADIENGDLEAGLIHRLDNDTSGLIIAAKNQPIYEQLREIISTESIEKIYLALVVGRPPDSGMIDKDIAHHPRKKKKMITCDSREVSDNYGGRAAKTDYSAVEHYLLESTEYTLLEVKIGSGVRHQIRVHLASIGYPIAGDALYQSSNKKTADILSPKRHLLHSYKMIFDHSQSGKPLTLECPLGTDFKGYLNRLSKI